MTGWILPDRHSYHSYPAHPRRVTLTLFQSLFAKVQLKNEDVYSHPLVHGPHAAAGVL